MTSRFAPNLLMLTDAASRRRLFQARGEVPATKRHQSPPLGSRYSLTGVGREVKTCAPPLSSDGTQLHVTRAWAVGCFLPVFAQVHDTGTRDPDVYVDRITSQLLPSFVRPGFQPPPATLELMRRIQLAVAWILRQDGVDVPLPPEPSYPALRVTRRIRPRWVRALLTGWP